jgi:orotate phosphoribosyltransferase
MLDKEEAVKIFTVSGALMEGHFRLTSGRHSNRYMQCAQVLQYPNYTEQLALDIAEKFKDVQIDYVVGPAMGGIIVSYEVARQLKVPGSSAAAGRKMELVGGFRIEPANVSGGRRCVTTGDR